MNESSDDILAKHKKVLEFTGAHIQDIKNTRRFVEILEDEVAILKRTVTDLTEEVKLLKNMKDIQRPLLTRHYWISDDFRE